MPLGSSHKISESTRGEICGICYREDGLKVNATHKVEEVLFGDVELYGHPFTRYVCCKHFGFIFGNLADHWCGNEK